MEARNLRILSGEGSGRQIVRLIHDQLQDVEEYKASVMLTTMAAAVRFERSPWDLLQELAEDAPDGEVWDEALPDVRQMIEESESPETGIDD